MIQTEVIGFQYIYNWLSVCKSLVLLPRQSVTLTAGLETPPRQQVYARPVRHGGIVQSVHLRHPPWMEFSKDFWANLRSEERR